MTTAIKFIQDHGIGRARGVVEGAPNTDNFYCHKFNIGNIKIRESFCDKSDQFHTISISELKRLVESVDIVSRACGAERVIELHNRYKDSYIAHKYWLGVRVDRMKQAIADYEEIYPK